jgi:PAS domain S-box-containing protein
VEWDPAAEERFGWRETAEGTDVAWWAERLHPEDRAAAEEAFDAVREGRAPEMVATYRFRHADGGWVPVRDRGYPLLDDDGRLARIVGVMVEAAAPARLSFPLPPLGAWAPGG